MPDVTAGYRRQNSFHHIRLKVDYFSGGYPHQFSQRLNHFKRRSNKPSYMKYYRIIIVYFDKIQLETNKRKNDEFNYENKV